MNQEGRILVNIYQANLSPVSPSCLYTHTGVRSVAVALLGRRLTPLEPEMNGWMAEKQLAAAAAAGRVFDE